jgi:hypothetical protein
VICVSARLLVHQSSAVPGGSVSYAIWIWSTVPAKQVSATAAIDGHGMRALRFSLCPARLKAAHKTICKVGALPANQAYELIAKASVGRHVIAGEQVTLTVTVQAKSLSPAEASVTALVGQASPTPVGTGSLPTLPPVTLPPIPNPGGVSPTDLSGLFPTVTPSSTPSTSGGTAGQPAHRGTAVIRPTSSTLPLDPRLVGGQLAGLAVLAAAITMVVARLSLRTPQSSAKAAGQAKPPAEPK